MAKITVATEEKVFKITKFLGLNECPDGDTQLKLGEASEMKNWRITPEHHLRVRPGYETVKHFEGPIRGLWSGYVAGEQKTICAADGGVWEMDADYFRRIGDSADANTIFFGFGNKVYLLNGQEYLVWDGEGFVDTVDGYIPLVSTAVAPAGSGTTVENVNRLTGKRRVRFSADGKATEYQLPEKELISIDKVKIGTEDYMDGWTADPTEGKLTFDHAPEEGESNVEVWYTAPNTRRAEVESMRFSEMFNGASDTRVFLYGDGSAKAIYCGVTENGVASAEYFPDLYEMIVGAENAPITGMVKYYNRLMSYKADGGAFSTSYEVTTLADGTAVPGFMTVSLHREIGCDTPGQVRLVKNVPRAMFRSNLYDWVYASYVSRDEKNAKLVSQKVQATLRRADPAKVYTFDDDAKQEYYLFLNDDAGTVIVHNYQIDAWYTYTGLPTVCACRSSKGLYFGFSDGRLVRFDEIRPNDDGKPIEALFASGNMAFDRDYQKKHSSTIWVSMQPSANANLIVSARSDRRTDYLDKVVTQVLFSFSNADFTSWSFLTNRQPQMERLKLKVKKFVFYQLLLKSNHASSDATVLGVDMRVRYTGYVK